MLIKEMNKIITFSLRLVGSIVVNVVTRIGSRVRTQVKIRASI